MCEVTVPCSLLHRALGAGAHAAAAHCCGWRRVRISRLPRSIATSKCNALQLMVYGTAQITAPVQMVPTANVCRPSGTEFAGELADFINRDLAKIDIGRAKDTR